MKRFINGILVFSFATFVLPICVMAANHNLDSSALVLNCDKTTVYPGDRITCTLDADLTNTSLTNVKSTGMNAQLSLSDNLTFVSFEKNGFFESGGNVERLENTNDYSIVMFNSNVDGKTGKFSYGTLVVSVDSGAEGTTALISLQDVKLSLEVNGSTDRGLVSVEPKQITVSNGTNTNTNTNSGENTNTNTNANSGENTNTNANTNSGENTNDDGATSDASKTSNKNPDNPGTGVTISALGISALIIGAVSYILLRKKNYFNKI